MNSIEKGIPSQMNDTYVLNESERLFSCWGSVQMKDKQSDLIPISEFMKVMPVMMKRGGVIMDSHTNRHVGRLVNYEFKEKKGKPAILLTGQVYKDYPYDDIVWSKVKSGEYGGMSFGGQNQASNNV